MALGLVFVPVVFFAFYIPDFKLDASSESIILEHDDALKYYRASRAIYGSDDFLIVVYTPHDDLFSPSSLAHLKNSAMNWPGSIRSKQSTPSWMCHS